MCTHSRFSKKEVLGQCGPKFAAKNEKARTNDADHFIILGCIDKPNPVVNNHLSGLAITRQLERHSAINAARPCTQVRILPFHPARHHADSSKSFPKKFSRCPFPFEKRRLCSHLASHLGRALPATLLSRKCEACSDFPPLHGRSQKRAIA